MLANFAEAARAHVTDFKMKHFGDLLTNHNEPENAHQMFSHFIHEKLMEVHGVPSNSIAINEISGQANFVELAKGTYADPDPVKTNNTQKFYVEGIWNIDGSVLDNVYFYCNLAGVKVFEQTFPCSAGDAHCPTPAGNVGEDWKGMFTFDVPAVAPPFEYDVHVIGQKADKTSLFELESKFRI